jgi:hypothetical protein
MKESFPPPEQDLMQLSPWEFDQTLKGWRKLQDEGEFIKAADLILEYVQQNRDRITNPVNNERKVSLELLFFHRGQMLALSGKENWQEAVESFKRALQDDECWNAYVSATIGFLEGDKQKIEQAIVTIESSQQEEKRGGNIGIVKNFKKALEERIRDYNTPYSWPKES